MTKRMIDGSLERVDDHTVRSASHQVRAVGAGGSLQLSDRHPASRLQAAVLREPYRHRPLPARRVRGGRQGDPEASRRATIGAATSISTRSTTCTTTPTTSSRPSLRARRTPSTSSASSRCRWPSRSTATSSPRARRRRCAAASTSTEEPFDDKRVRQAITMSVDNAAMKALIFPEGGDVGENHHVAPIHPEYFELPKLKRDVGGRQGAAQGRRQGESRDHHRRRQHRRAVAAGGRPSSMRDQLADAGITLNVNVMPASKYWEVWTVDAVRRDRLDPPPARHHGAVARLSRRRRLERDAATTIPNGRSTSTPPRRRWTWKPAAS